MRRGASGAGRDAESTRRIGIDVGDGIGGGSVAVGAASRLARGVSTIGPMLRPGLGAEAGPTCGGNGGASSTVRSISPNSPGPPEPNRRCVGVAVGVLVAVLVGVSVGVFVGVAVGVSVGVAVGVYVGVGVSVGVCVGVNDGLGVREGATVRVMDGAAVRETSGVGVTEGCRCAPSAASGGSRNAAISATAVTTRKPAKASHCVRTKGALSRG